MSARPVSETRWWGRSHARPASAWILVAGLLATAGIPSTAAAQTGSAKPVRVSTDAPPDTSGLLEGRVTTAGRVVTAVVTVRAVGSDSSAQRKVAGTEVVGSHSAGSNAPGSHIEVSRASVTASAIGSATASATTDARGRYRVSMLAPGTYLVIVRSVGFEPDSASITIVVGALEHNVSLRPVQRELTALVTTATLRSTTVDASPVKVELFTSAFFRKNVTNNLTESIKQMNGLQVQQDCGVCGTNSIHINGMDGPYTAILIDGSPIMGNLANVYGLNGINPSIIQQVEVVKGPASTLYGSEAMGGVVNIITKDARFAPRASAELWRSTDGESNADVALALAGTRVQSLVSATLADNPAFNDRNHDGFNDIARYRRFALFNKWTIGRPAEPTFTASVKVYDESRVGGVADWTASDRCTEQHYGESITTKRGEVVGRLRVSSRLRMDFSGSLHRQRSCYGVTRYDADQRVLVDQLVWNDQLGANHDVVAGLTLRHQQYADNTPVTANGRAPDAQFIPGLFMQDEFALTPRVSLLTGLRVDHHARQGVVSSPRAALKWSPTDDQTVRINASTGFRLVNLFSEDHAALSGLRRLVIPEELAPERSVNGTVNYHAHLAHAPRDIELDIDAFYTRFSNRIAANYDIDPTATVYENLRGHAITQGVAANLSVEPAGSGVSGSIGATLQQLSLVQDGVRRTQEFSPTFTGVFSASYASPRTGYSLDWTGRVVSPMELPSCMDSNGVACAGIPARGPWFVDQSLQLSKRWRGGMESFVAIKNLGNVQVARPIYDTRRPFDSDFQTNFVWGPVQARRMVLGARYILAR